MYTYKCIQVLAFVDPGAGLAGEAALADAKRLGLRGVLLHPSAEAHSNLLS